MGLESLLLALWHGRRVGVRAGRPILFWRRHPESRDTVWVEGGLGRRSFAHDKRSVLRRSLMITVSRVEVQVRSLIITVSEPGSYGTGLSDISFH